MTYIHLMCGSSKITNIGYQPPTHSPSASGLGFKVPLLMQSGFSNWLSSFHFGADPSVFRPPKKDPFGGLVRNHVLASTLALVRSLDARSPSAPPFGGRGTKRTPKTTKSETIPPLGITTEKGQMHCGARYGTGLLLRSIDNGWGDHDPYGIGAHPFSRRSHSP